MPINDPKTAEEKLTYAKTVLMFDHPFFGLTLASLPIKEDKNLRIKTMATDGKNIFFDRNFVENELSKKETIGVLLHELLHVIYFHTYKPRVGDRDPTRWNLAIDYRVNYDILNMHGKKYELPSLLYDEKYAEMSAEEIYDAMPDGEENKYKPFDIHILSDLTAEELQELKEKIITAHEASKDSQDNFGNLPNSLKRIIGEILNPKIPWEIKLARFFSQTLGDTDTSYSEPDRRFISSDVYIPGPVSDKMQNLVCVFDTSGSVDKEMLTRFASELMKAAQYTQELTVMSCDCETHETVSIYSADEFLRKFEFKGGGGTDFRPPFEKLKENHQHPDALVYFTDGEGTFPTETAQYPVIWCIIGNKQIIPPFGEVASL